MRKLDNSLSMGDEHLDTIPETESDELIKSSVEEPYLLTILTDDNSSCDVDSPFGEDIDYFVNISRYDILREKLLNVNLLIAKIDSLRDNPTPSSEVVIKSTSTFPNLFLEETYTLLNSIPDLKLSALI
ncbi:hypothetical protein Tco_0407633 [Tanacetum coccineum]